MAALILVSLRLKHDGLLSQLNAEHLHDLGKLLFGFLVFWAYVGFSQYMLIWYGNIPEETRFFARRLAGGWENISVLLVVGHFVLPFAFLISSRMKRRPSTLRLAAAWILFMHWLDLYWLIMPNQSPRFALPQMLDVLALFVLGCIGLVVLITLLGRSALIPEGDPRLQESLELENVLP